MQAKDSSILRKSELHHTGRILLVANGLQPRNWGDDSSRINYDELREPNLEPYMETIKNLNLKNKTKTIIHTNNPIP